jgi:transcriptional regulator with XRE-family HTH domain
MEEQMKIDGAKIRRLRDIQGWSQELLAEAAGVSLRTVQRAEAQGTASRETRVCLAAALGIAHTELDLHETDAPSVGSRGSDSGVALQGAVVPVPRFVRVVSGVMALFAFVMLLLAVPWVQADPSLIHLVFLAPLAATLWAAYVAIRGGVPRALLYSKWALYFSMSGGSRQ